MEHERTTTRTVTGTIRLGYDDLYVAVTAYVLDKFGSEVPDGAVFTLDFSWDEHGGCVDARADVGYERTFTELNDGPSKLLEGARNETLSKIACDFKKVGLFDRECWSALLMLNANWCDPPLGELELAEILHVAYGQDPSEPASEVSAAEQVEDSQGVSSTDRDGPVVRSSASDVGEGGR